MLEQFGLHVRRQAEATALLQALAIFIDHHGAEHFLALAAAGDAVGLDAGKHAAQELGDEDALIFLGGRVRLGGVASRPRRRRQRRGLGHHQAGGSARVHQPITWMSAWSAPAALMACRMEMRSPGPTPSALSPSTRCCSETPSSIPVILLPLLSSIWMLV